MLFNTSLTRLLSIEHPVILAPMGFVSGGALAGAVSAAGGFGIIGGGYAYPDWLEREFGAAGNHPVGCGFITCALAERPASLDLALSYHPAAIMLSFGDACTVPAQDQESRRAGNLSGAAPRPSPHSADGRRRYYRRPRYRSRGSWRRALDAASGAGGR